MTAKHTFMLSVLKHEIPETKKRTLRTLWNKIIEIRLKVNGLIKLVMFYRSNRTSVPHCP